MKVEQTGTASAGHGSLKSYVIGFVLSVILTVIPFGMVMSGAFSYSTTLISIAVLAIVQILVHVIYFLHMDRTSEEGWNLLSFIFTVLIVAILVIGALWIMFHLNHNVMMGH